MIHVISVLFKALGNKIYSAVYKETAPGVPKK